MALLDSFKKKEDAPQAQKQIYLDTIIGMKNQGYTNEQIFQVLSSQGYEQAQIFDALNQADIKMTMDYQQPAAPSAAPDVLNDSFYSSQTMSKEKIEEIAEAIIDEKWEEFAQNLDRIIKWKEKTETKFIEMESDIKHLREDFDKIHTSILEKIGDYDSHISNVGTSLKAMEQAFSKVLPGFVENVSELSRITKNMREMQPQNKK